MHDLHNGKFTGLWKSSNSINSLGKDYTFLGFDMRHTISTQDWIVISDK